MESGSLPPTQLFHTQTTGHLVISHSGISLRCTLLVIEEVTQILLFIYKHCYLDQIILTICLREMYNRESVLLHQIQIINVTDVMQCRKYFKTCLMQPPLEMFPSVF